MGEGSLKQNGTKRLQKGPKLPNLSAKTYVNWRLRVAQGRPAGRRGGGGTGRDAEVRRECKAEVEQGPSTGSSPARVIDPFSLLPHPITQF